MEDAGGILWTFWRIIDGSLSSREGLWINTRLVTIQVCQMITSGLLAVGLILVTGRLAKEADQYRASISVDHAELLNIFPTGAMVKKSLYPASIVAIVMMVIITILYIPSAMSTVLKYRCGALPSLGSLYFETYRQSVDLVSVMNSLKTSSDCDLTVVRKPDTDLLQCWECNLWDDR